MQDTISFLFLFVRFRVPSGANFKEVIKIELCNQSTFTVGNSEKVFLFPVLFTFIIESKSQLVYPNNMFFQTLRRRRSRSTLKDR